MTTAPRPAILAFATQGHGGNEEARIRELLRNFDVEIFPFDRKKKRQSFRQLRRLIRERRPDLVVMEGSGIAGGMALLLGRWFTGTRYVLSSGDAIGPWIGSHYRFLGPAFAVYERLLCRWADGFIGWTPYLVGRALTFGTPRAITAAGWAPFPLPRDQWAEARGRVRARLGIPDDALVLGIAGAMIWNRRYRFCYGSDLVRALGRSRRTDAVVLLVGDGTGVPKLQELAAGLRTGAVVFTGRVPQHDVPEYLVAMDIGSLPQSTDRTGSFRFTTKISEYIAAGLPVVTNQVPMGYDLDDGWIWRLPGDMPWDDRYLEALADLIDRLTPEELTRKRAAVPTGHPMFDREQQVARVTAFIDELISRRGRIDGRD